MNSCGLVERYQRFRGTCSNSRIAGLNPLRGINLYLKMYVMFSPVDARLFVRPIFSPRNSIT
jgi:hypothetical protein